MSHLYTIMPLDTEHVDEICEDIRWQYENGVADCALFMIKLVPEGDPVIDKAAIECEKYARFREKLESMGLSCGVLVQCTIGHGYALNQLSPFQRVVQLVEGKTTYVACPSDEGFQKYIQNQLATIAAQKPQVIMIDDDFRLMYRPGKGCACPNHMTAFNYAAGTDLSREELFAILQDGSAKSEQGGPNLDVETCERYTDIYVNTQRESLLAGARAMRAGIDSVDPSLPGIFCSVGHTTEFAAEIAQILAGKGNPVVVRINNGNYTPEGARWLSRVAYRAAQQSEVLRRDVDVILAETDTCPQNRYSTGAQSLHAHFTASILEGAAGAKHWISRLSTFEPRSGKAYRTKLAKNKGFYEALAKLVPEISWQGCRIPLPVKPDYGFKHEGWYSPSDAWSACVLERLGLPIYFSSKPDGAAFLEEESVHAFTDEEILEMFKGPFFLSSEAARQLNKRGFKAYTGVDVQPWTGAHPSFERLHVNGKKTNAQIGIQQLIPQSDRVETMSTVIHLKDGVQEIPLFPGVTVFKNELGGQSIVFCGTPRTKFHYTEAFAFLSESRKEQMIQLLSACGNLPVYYTEDAEVYMKAGTLSDGSLLTAVFNIGLDPLEEIPLVVDRQVRGVQRLTAEGRWEACEWQPMTDCKNHGILVDTPAYTLEPVILRIG
ncbi:MAG: hypothetical protein IJN87_11015 [Firmicutes bacterium]|nr:hypothetical protein [Bacillota bacterium]